MADANRIIERLTAQVAALVRDNTILAVELDELRESIAEHADGKKGE